MIPRADMNMDDRAVQPRRPTNLVASLVGFQNILSTAGEFGDLRKELGVSTSESLRCEGESGRTIDQGRIQAVHDRGH
jgi:hypothetical protein